MKLAVLTYRLIPHMSDEPEIEAALVYVDPIANRTLGLLPVPSSPNVAVFADYDCAAVSYCQYTDCAETHEWLDVYSLLDLKLKAHLPMDCRAHFNVSPQWSTFIQSPEVGLVYVYKARTLGDHWAQDFVCGLDLQNLRFTTWNHRIPECVAGWSACGGRAHAQMLFVSDGLEVGKLPSSGLKQKIAFWLGPHEGMGPSVDLGPRPRAHNDPGHARAILFARHQALSVAVCTDGAVHLIDPIRFRYLERQQMEIADDHVVPNFAAQVDPWARFLYVGTASYEFRSRGITQRIVVHDLQRGRRQNEWVLERPFSHMVLTADGDYLCGASSDSDELWVIDVRTGEAKAVMPLDGSPQYVMLGD